MAMGREAGGRRCTGRRIYRVSTSGEFRAGDTGRVIRDGWNFDPGQGGLVRWVWADGEGRGPRTEREALPCRDAREGRRLMSRERGGLAQVTQWSG